MLSPYHVIGTLPTTRPSQQVDSIELGAKLVRHPRFHLDVESISVAPDMPFTDEPNVGREALALSRQQWLDPREPSMTGETRTDRVGVELTIRIDCSIGKHTVTIDSRPALHPTLLQNLREDLETIEPLAVTGDLAFELKMVVINPHEE